MTIGINIPDLSSRQKRYATEAWTLYIQYLLEHGIDEIYTQTWSGNYRVLGLMEKVGFVECHRKEGNRLVRGERFDALTLKLDIGRFCNFLSSNE